MHVDVWDDEGKPEAHAHLGRVTLGWAELLRADVLALPLREGPEESGGGDDRKSKDDKKKGGGKDAPVTGTLELRARGHPTLSGHTAGARTPGVKEGT